ncbi:hypothetical protein B0A67_06050 [Flavobacterium aquidurense]|uniref:hypothetical protein n=1 Tax=Flavobacterium aquidurense TaxID=362413 RepID=UPI00091081FB|nr:hypothetical protein [Flavobacterium aquidurense]OXA73004.1 hypothetical protein B0A67_06050 [Flavobacterium aquidurense]SHH16458.1 hypothetical protein SAMN05444481_112109 [Flavobacterium frigidimaris]
MIYIERKKDVERLNEKAMFTNISWSNYIIAVSVLLFIWYLVLGFRFYYPELKEILNGEKTLNLTSFKSNRNEMPGANLSKDSSTENLEFSSCSEPFDTLADAKELSDRIKGAITESAERNFSLEEFQNYLKLLLKEYPFVKISALRQKVNTLIVAGCQRYPQLLLTVSQADALWEETI